MKIKNWKNFKIDESAKDFNVGDSVIYTFNGKDYSGKIVDHFGDGIMLNLEKSISYPNPVHNANPMGYNTDLSAQSFELYDGEENPWGSIKMLRKK